MLLASLSAAQKAGIAGMGAAFIVFALVSSFVVPRYRPNFPGRSVWPYVGLVVCSHDAKASETAVFSNVSMKAETPAREPGPSK